MKSGINRLTGLILSSEDPGRLASFYKEVLGIPLELNQHGNLPEHWECDFEGIHYAILKQHDQEKSPGNIVPSFSVPDIDTFVKAHGLVMLHPIIDLGNGSYVGSIKDRDGNTVRLWMNTKDN